MTTTEHEKRCWCGGLVGPREPGDEQGLGCLENIIHGWRDAEVDGLGGKWHQTGEDEAHERRQCAPTECGWEPIND